MPTKESTLPRFLYLSDTPQHETILILHNRPPHCILRTHVDKTDTLSLTVEKEIDHCTKQELSEIREKAEQWFRNWLTASLNIEDEYTPDLSKIKIDLTLDEARDELEAAMFDQSAELQTSMATTFFRQLGREHAPGLARDIIAEAANHPHESPAHHCLDNALEATDPEKKIIEAAFVASRVTR